MIYFFQKLMCALFHRKTHRVRELAGTTHVRCRKSWCRAEWFET